MKNEESNEGGLLMFAIALAIAIKMQNAGIPVETLGSRIVDAVARLFMGLLWLAGIAAALWLLSQLIIAINGAIKRVQKWKRSVDIKLSELKATCHSHQSSLDSQWFGWSDLAKKIKNLESQIEALKGHTGFQAKEVLESAAKEFTGEGR